MLPQFFGALTCCKVLRWEGVCVFRGGQTGRLPLPLGERGAQAALGTNTAVLARRQGSACVWCSKHDRFGFLWKGPEEDDAMPLDLACPEEGAPIISKVAFPHPPHPLFFVLFFYFVSSVAPKCFFFLRLWENELRISFGLVPKLKMKSLFHLAYIYSKDSCASAVQEEHEECIG